MTEGIAVVIILLWVPPRLPSNSFSAALPKPVEEKRHKGRYLWPDCLQLVRMRTMISFSSGPAWKKKNPALLGGMGKEFLANESSFNQESSGIYIDCDPFLLKQSEPQKPLRGMWPVALERTMWLLNHCFSGPRTGKIYLDACFSKAGSHPWEVESIGLE